MKKTPLKRGNKQLKRTPFKKKIKVKKISPKTLQNKCDALLTPIIKLIYPKCLLCGQDTQVAHHHIHKSKSAVLRYVIENLIPLCNKCHLALHMNESYHASRIVKIRGIEWFDKLEKEKNKIIKVDRFYYEEKLEWLKNTINKLSTS